MRLRSDITRNSITPRDQRIAEISNALAHPIRVALVRHLNEKNAGHGEGNLTCNKDLVEMFPFSQSTISQHLKILKDCGLFYTEIKNKFTYYTLNKYLLKEYLNSLSF